MPANYDKYLRSNKWDNIRKSVFERDNYKCQECGQEEDLTVHHKTYEHIFHEEEHLDDLVTLCKACHCEMHELEPIVIDDGDTYLKFTNLIKTSKRKKFTKVFQTKDPNLSKASYYQCWYKILCHLSKNTNIIFTRTNKKNILCSSIQDLVKLSGKARGTFYRFYKEACKKNLIKKVTFNDTFFVINPKYALNGSKMPKSLLDYFS